MRGLLEEPTEALAPGTYVSSISKQGSSDLTGAVTLTATGSATLTQAGQNIEISVVGGSGDVSKVGTPVNNQVGVWTGDGTLEGTTKLTFDNTLGKLVVGVLSSDTYLTISETSIIGGVPLTVDTTGNNLSISASEGNGTGNGGNIFISAGAGGATGVEGSISLFRNTTGVNAFLDLASLTVDRTFTFPDNTGTIALTSDITTGLTQPQLMARLSIGF